MPGSIILDEPVTYGGWSPKNWDGKYVGPTTVRQGIWHSMNVLAVKTFMMVGCGYGLSVSAGLWLYHD